MESILKLIFLLNSISLPLSILIIDLLTRQKENVISISDFVRIGKDPLIFLEIVLMSGNFIQAIFSLYLFINHGFPLFIIFGALAGLIGILVSFTRIDKYYKRHTLMTIASLALYSISILVTSILLGNSLMILIGLIQIIGVILGFGLKLKTKHIEVFYFTLFGIWNILVIVTFLK